ncbi:MAG: hypothetical protein K0S33_1654 [Bacteroidetes bacterium]|jgi:gingipain R|nr:hypothetical protein [Bacteroidota bacterium]
MRKFLLLAIFSPLMGLAQNGFKVLNETNSFIELEYTLNDYSLSNITYKGQNCQSIKAPGTVPLLEKGAPELRSSSVALSIPGTGNPTIEIISGQLSLKSNVNLLPSKGSLKRNVDPAGIDYTFGESYTKNAFYSVQQARLGKAFQLRNERGIVLSVSPFQYNPQAKALVVYTSMKIRVYYNEGTAGQNERAGAKAVYSKDEQALYQNKFINYHATTQYVPIPEQGSMLVICADNYLSTMKPFVDWKNQKGIKTVMVPTSQTGADQTSLYNFIQGYYSSNPDLLYLLLVGDHEDINTADLGQSGSETLWSDTWYAFQNGSDVYPELFVGRFSGEYIPHIQTMVDRTLEYEKNPAPGSWYSTAIGIGSGEGDGYGDDGEADWQHERNMGTKLLNWGYTTFHEFYDGSRGGNDAAGDPTPAMVETAVNDGASLFMYTGHGWDAGCVTSNYTTAEVAAATNNGKYPFVVSVACNNGTFANANCFAEEFVRAANVNGPTGSIACAGSSILMAWAEPMSVQDEIVEILTDQYANNKKITLGGLFYNGGLKMLDDYQNATADEVMETWVLFGDPSCVMRSREPSQITANLDPCYPPGNNLMTITSPDEGALVALSVNDTLLGTAYVQNGTASVSYTTTSTSPLLVTISGYNMLPFQGTVNPCAIGLANVSATNGIKIYPNPAHDMLQVETPGAMFDIKIIDALGRVVYNATALQSKESINTSAIAKGIYTVQLASEGRQYIQKLVID